MAYFANFRQFITLWVNKVQFLSLDRGEETSLGVKLKEKKKRLSLFPKVSLPLEPYPFQYLYLSQKIKRKYIFTYMQNILFIYIFSTKSYRDIYIYTYILM